MKEGRPRGRPPGVPLHRLRAVEAAILDALVRERHDGPLVRRGRAYPPGWERANARQVQRHVVQVLGELGFRVSERTVRAAWHGPAVPLPHDPRAKDWPMLVRWAADMLNFDGHERRDRIIDAVGNWCIAETKAGRPYPRTAHELARTLRAEKWASK